MDTATPGHVTSRRSLLTAGTAGLAATALLAACSDDGPAPGLSGSPVTEPEVPPTVPEKEPTAAELQADLDTLATANSLQLLAADVYRRFGPRFESPDLRAAAERFVADHEAAAEVFAAEVGEHEGLGKPNEYLLTNQVAPVERLLDNDEAIAELASDIESAITATYITAVGTLLEPAWRQRIMEHGAAAARRAAVLANGGTGLTPTAALYPLSDLISNDAYLHTATEAEAAEAAEEAETDAAEVGNAGGAETDSGE